MQVWRDLKMPEYMGEITKLVTSGGAISEVWKSGGLMLACAIASLTYQPNLLKNRNYFKKMKYIFIKI